MSRRRWDEPWTYAEADPAEDQVRLRVIDPLLAIGVFQTTPLLEPVGDTSDTGTSLAVSIRLLEESAGFGVAALHSGFKGKHAQAIRRVLEAVLQLAGYAGEYPTVLIVPSSER